MHTVNTKISVQWVNNLIAQWHTIRLENNFNIDSLKEFADLNHKYQPLFFWIIFSQTNHSN